MTLHSDSTTFPKSPSLGGQVGSTSRVSTLQNRVGAVISPHLDTIRSNSSGAQAALADNHGNAYCTCHCTIYSLSHLLTHLVLMAYIVHVSLVLINDLRFYRNDPSCHMFQTWVTYTYQLSKCAFYALLVSRFLLAFRQASSTTLKTSFYRCYAKLVSLLVLVYFALASFTLFSGAVTAYYDQHLGVCVSRIPKWAIAAAAGFDLFISLSTIYLFVKPLWTLIQKTTNAANEFRLLISKYFLLVMTAMVSSLLAIAIFGWTGDTLVMPMADCINALCVLLMSSVHHKVYRICCAAWYHRFPFCKQAEEGTPKSHHAKDEMERTYTTETRKDERETTEPKAEARMAVEETV